jgi:hypothetical protein
MVLKVDASCRSRECRSATVRWPEKNQALAPGDALSEPARRPVLVPGQCVLSAADWPGTKPAAPDAVERDQGRRQATSAGLAR